MEQPKRDTNVHDRYTYKSIKVHRKMHWRTKALLKSYSAFILCSVDWRLSVERSIRDGDKQKMLIRTSATVDIGDIAPDTIIRSADGDRTVWSETCDRRANESTRRWSIYRTIWMPNSISFALCRGNENWLSFPSGAETNHTFCRVLYSQKKTKKKLLISASTFVFDLNFLKKCARAFFIWKWMKRRDRPVWSSVEHSVLYCLYVTRSVDCLSSTSDLFAQTIVTFLSYLVRRLAVYVCFTRFRSRLLFLFVHLKFVFLFFFFWWVPIAVDDVVRSFNCTVWITRLGLVEIPNSNGIAGSKL